MTKSVLLALLVLLAIGVLITSSFLADSAAEGAEDAPSPVALRDSILATSHFRLMAHDTALSISEASAIAAQLESQCAQFKEWLGTAAGPVPALPVHLYQSIEQMGLDLKETTPAFADFEGYRMNLVTDSCLGAIAEHRQNALLLRHWLGKPAHMAWESGLALYFNPDWKTRGAAYWTGLLYTSGNLPPLAEIMDNAWFEKESPLVMTSSAATLVQFLIEHWGKEAFLARYRDATALPPAELAALQPPWQGWLAQQYADFQRDVPVRAPLGQLMQGFNFAHEGYRIYNSYGSAQARQSLDTLKALGGNAIAVVPYSYMRQPQVPSYLPLMRRAGSETDESVIVSQRCAQRLGMKAMLKPQIWIRGGWPGDVAMSNDADWAQFFDYYHRWMRHYALLAEMHGFDLLCVGVEFTQATLQREADWRRLIGLLRGIYSGPMTYAANWGEEFEGVQFWDDLDYIGIDCYYPLSESPQIDRATLAAKFARVTARIREAHEAFQKPVLFTEIGFRSIEAPWQMPHEEPKGKSYNGEHQAICYDVVLEELHKADWVHGIFWWKWSSYLSYDQRGQTGYSPYDKPAQAVVQRYFQQARQNKH